ncbi:MAG: hypothetical protein ABSB84_06380 [Verrucomicrobiota bacterium]
MLDNLNFQWKNAQFGNIIYAMVANSKNQDEIPEYFYKYRSFSGINRDRTGCEIVNGGIWFSEPSDFKDKSDCGTPVSHYATPEAFRAWAETALLVVMSNLAENERCALIDDAIKNRVYADPDRINRHRDWYKNQVMQRGVLSLCSTNVSDRMWREYADNNQGCCFEFKRSERGMFANVEKARYEEKLPTVNSYEMPYVEMNNAIMLTKTHEHDFEHEWRIWDSRGRGYWKYNKGDLTGLIFGRLMPTEDRNLLTYLTRRSHPSAILYEAVETENGLKIILFEN